jgi:orotate phosphoribosyltransferase
LAAIPKKNKEYLVSELGKVFVKMSAFRIGDFKTSKGTKTPYYITLNQVSSFPNVSSLVMDCLEHKISEISRKSKVDVLCGVPVTGLIFSAAIAGRLSLPLVHAPLDQDRKIVGVISSGANVLVLDDVSETGKTIELAAVAARANGGEVSSALTLVDRMEGAKEDLKKLGIELYSFTTIQELGKKLRENMALSDEEEAILDNA